jgi:Flp pilus assembly protein protease CpaA
VLDTVILIVLSISSIWIACTDLKRRVIANKITIPLFGSLLLIRIVEGHFLSYLPGFLLTAVLLFVIAYFTKGGIGGGDIKWMAALSFGIPSIGSVSVLLICQLYGLLVGLYLFLFKKKNREIPLGPGFAIGFFIYLLLIR